MSTTLREHVQAQADRRRTLRDQATGFGVLFSHASRTVWPDLVQGGFETLLDATEHGAHVARVSGVQYTVMYAMPDPEHPGQTVWLDGHGYTADEAIADFQHTWRLGVHSEPSPRLSRYTP